MEKKPVIMVNGLSPDAGQMAYEVAKKIIDSQDLELFDASFTGPDVEKEYMNVVGEPVALIVPENRCDAWGTVMENVDLVVDFTTPSAIGDNARDYTRHNMPFVMGTTGGDRESLERVVRRSNIGAVIAPNMSAEVVEIQDAVRSFALKNKDRWVQDKDSGLYVIESHQGFVPWEGIRGKADTSGTAKAMAGYFREIGFVLHEGF